MKNNNLYNLENFFYFKGLDAVRKRPGMYIGDVEDGSGLHQMIYELISNAVDEVLINACNIITVILYSDNSICIKDNGRGIPITNFKNTNIPICQLLATELHSGGKFNNNIYMYSGGTHGVGLTVVNALSRRLYMIIYKNPFIYEMIFYKGKLFSKLKKINITNKYGTLIRFYYDKKIFINNKIEIEWIENKLFEISCLNHKLVINFFVEKLNLFKVFKENNIINLLNKISNNNDIINGFFFKKIIDNTIIEIAIKWSNLTSESILCFTNSIFQLHGGSHLSGFKSGLTQFFNYFISNKSKEYRKHLKYKNLLKTIDLNILNDVIKIGLCAVISVKTPSPKFSSQIKDKLVSKEIKKYVELTTFDLLNKFFESNTEDFLKIFYHIITLMNNKLLSNNIKKLFDNNSKTISLDTLYHLNNKNIANNELYIVEGESAGGSAKQARFSNQYIYPLKGKILNVIKSDINEIFLCKELVNLAKCIGYKIISNTFVLHKLLFDKIIIMTDADIDGCHILSLVLSFFLLFLPELILKKKIFFINVPLYSITYNKNCKYLFQKKSIELIKLFIFLKKKIFKDKYFKFSLYSIIFYSKIVTNFNIFVNKFPMFFIYLKYFPILNINLLSDFTFLNLWILNFKKFFNLNFVYKIIYSIKFKIFELHIFYNLNNVFIFNFKFLNSFFYKNICLNYNNLFFFINFKNFNSNLIYKDKFFNFSNLNNFNIDIKRYKGLGEMNPDQLRDITMNKNNRKLLCVNVKNFIYSKLFIKLLMGKNINSKKLFLFKNISNKYFYE